jgi:hypothetical protein
VAQDPEVATKTALPEVVADDDGGTPSRDPLVVAREGAAQSGRHAKHLEVVARDEPAPNDLHRAAVGAVISIRPERPAASRPVNTRF